MEHPIFQKVDGLPVIICKACEHGVWPNEIVSHLKNHVHRKPHAGAVQVQKAIQQWDGIAQNAQEAIIPDQIDEPVPGLPTYPDGLMCRRDYPGCRYIGRSINGMRWHWRKVHGWSPYGRGGYVLRAQRIQSEAELRQSYTVAIEAVRKAVEQAQARAGPIVEANDIRDANPWLRMTGWMRYLQDIPFSGLYASVETPLPDSDDPVEQGVRRIWEAIETVIRKNQQTVRHTGRAIRIEAVRSGKGQTPYRPLQAYMDAARPQNCADWTLRSTVAMDDFDSVYGSEDERESTVSHSTSSVKSQDPTYRIQRNQTSRKTFQDQVTYMVGQFMVRGTHTHQWRRCRTGVRKG
ncbi:hypothetical protein BDV30DRAFT_234770 [Aspergillus minisclerotigenes]|uniref:Uncharacterized protein n=1 Tax=Aspergillus minisclerotigenes TaxID=656917 RepID=A0A5N6JGL0_9EURO|nr:hypothetical protein BDV30DRAFT_234770 [Aspergillus minisclerotigenes]